MNSFDMTRMIIGIVLALGVAAVFINKTFLKRNSFTSKFITRCAIFSAFSVILYLVPFLKFQLPIFPGFLEIHLDEVPILISGFAYGPLSAVVITIVKTLIKIPFTKTMGVGELADLIYTLAFVIPASIIYKRKRNINNSLIAVLVGSGVQLVVSCFVTSFAILNFYMAVMGLSKEAILGMCQAVNPAVTSLGFTFLIMVALPFNAIKNALVIVITFLLYKRMHTLIDKKIEKN